VVGELAQPLQAKLLRVLQEKEFERVGGTKTIKANIRLMAATKRDLKAAMEQGAFRRDLYFRLNVVTVTLPAMRERPEDIARLAEHFIAKHSNQSPRGANILKGGNRGPAIVPGNAEQSLLYKAITHIGDLGDP
jgi:two-component system response regulator AtoC